MQMSNIEAVIFDLDGVITDTARYHYRAWKRLADELGIYFDETINERLKGIDRMASFEVILERATTTYSTSQKEAYANIKNGYYVASIDLLSKKDILEGIESFIGDLKKNNIKIALGSASKNADKIIERLGLKEYFDVIVDSAKVAKGKPDPEIFVTAAHMLGVAPEKCVVIEDSAAGIQAAVDGGMKAIGIGDKSLLVGANIVLAATKELLLEQVIQV